MLYSVRWILYPSLHLPWPSVSVWSVPLGIWWMRVQRLCVCLWCELAHYSNILRPLTRSNGNMTQDHHSIDLNFCLLNAQSLNNKAGEFTDLVCEYKPDVVALTETWFYPMESASRTLWTPVGYKLLDYPRTSRTGGGTEVLFRDNLTVKKGATAELRSFEYSDWDIKSETDQIHLTINYRTPYSDAHPVTTSVFFQKSSAFLESPVFLPKPSINYWRL